MLVSERYSDASSGTSRMVLTESAKRYAEPFQAPTIELVAAYEEDPARQEAEAVLQGVYERHEALLAADTLAAEQLRPDDQHRHHEQGGQHVAYDHVRRIMGIQDGWLQPRSRTQ